MYFVFVMLFAEVPAYIITDDPIKSELTAEKPVQRVQRWSQFRCVCGNKEVACKCGCDEVRCCLPCLREEGCFPGHSVVLLDTGELFRLKDLTTGKKVLTVEDGKRVFTEVKTFLKRKPSKNSTYLTLTTEQGRSVSMSSDHVVFVSRNNNSNNLGSSFARFVEPGDYVLSAQTNRHRLERVVQVSSSVKQGVYVPLTDSGTLVVDGILVSCYTTAAHELGHLFMTPVRWFPWLLKPWQQDGYSPIITLIKLVANLVVPESWKLIGDNYRLF